MTRPGRRTRVAFCLAVLLLTTACSPPRGKEAPLQTKSQAEVEALARYEADAIVTLTGGELGGWRTNATPCQGRNGEVADDGRWNLSGFAHVTLPADQHVTALQAVHESWTTQGWEIRDNRTLPDGVRGTLSGRDPASGLTVSLTSSNPPVQLALIVGSACYMPAAGEHPAS